MPFIGGSDDRAALQLAVRFRSQSQIRLMILHLVVAGQAQDQLDVELLQACKELEVSDDGLIFRSVEIGRDTLNPMLEILKTEQPNFDLVILGRSVKPPNTRRNSSGASGTRSIGNGVSGTRSIGNGASRPRSIGNGDSRPRTNESDANFSPRKISFKRSLSQKSLEVSAEEKIFGALGEMLFLMLEGPSLLVVHEFETGNYRMDQTNFTNSNYMLDQATFTNGNY